MRGRIRTFKPELFKDEELWDLGVETGLPVFQAFTGLWPYCDREGRFEWRPRALKTDVLPYWDGDFEAVLNALASRSFIVRYTVDGREYGWVRTLTKHQRFDHREVPSELPSPPEAAAQHPPGTPGHARAAPANDAEPGPGNPGHARVERKGRERNGKGIGREGLRALEGAGATSSRGDEQPDPELTEPPSYTRIPDDWRPSEALYADAFAHGVPREVLDEDVTYWRARKTLGGEFTSLDAFFRTHFTRLVKRRETEAFKAVRHGPEDERMRKQADRIELLREQEAREGAA